MQKQHLWQAENITAGTGLSVHQERTLQPKILHNTNEITLSIPWKKKNLHLAVEISNNWMQSLGEDMKNRNTEKKEDAIKQAMRY